MFEFVFVVGIAALLVTAIYLYQRQREQALIDRIDRAGSDPDAASGVVDEAIAEDRASAEFWRKQSGR